MKTENLILIGLLAAGGYWLYTKSQNSTPNAFVGTTEYQGNLFPSIPTFTPQSSTQSGVDYAAQNAAKINYLDTAAKNNQTVLFTTGSGSNKKVVGVQDATLGMSYRIEAAPAIQAKANASGSKGTIKTTSIVGTPYVTTSATIAKAVNNPLATAAAAKKLKK